MWSRWLLTCRVPRGKALHSSPGLAKGQKVFHWNEPVSEPFGCSVNTTTARAGLCVILNQIMIRDKKRCNESQNQVHL